ncbi:MAG: hypothetical protein Q7Q73_09345 [Verrucomicrobiota bacterium JB024]|nr:hypothetical protein [Verrucomicrobiota bacterium JB024]
MIEYITQHWDEILLIITSVIAAASAIAAITPTPKDDAVLKVIKGIVDKLALNVGKAKPKP